MDIDRILRRTALVLAVAALAWTLDTVLSTRRRCERLDDKAASVQELYRLAEAHSPDRAWLDSLDADGARIPPPLERLAEGRFPDGSAVSAPRTAIPLINGWQRRETLLTLSGIPFSELPDFCDEATRQRPPWHLVEIDLRPSSTAGTGDARLLFESIEHP